MGTSGKDCWFCKENRGDDSAPGGWIHEDAHWVAGHMPHTYGPPGLVVLESRRHFLERVYTWASMAQFPHMHVWLMPWTPDKPEGPAFLSASKRSSARRRRLSKPQPSCERC